MQIEIKPLPVVTTLLYVVLFLHFMNGLLLAFYFAFDGWETFGLLDYFDLDVEGNIPTLYSACAMLVCAGLLALIALESWRRRDAQRYYWSGLSVLFLLLALDEGTAIHEQLSDLMGEFMVAESVLYFLWVVPYGAALLILAGLLFRFVWSLPARTRRDFLLSAAIFISGAIGFEMLSAAVADRNGYDSPLYCFLYSIEELLEMLGVLLFMYALLKYLAALSGGLHIRLDNNERR